MKYKENLIYSFLDVLAVSENSFLIAYKLNKGICGPFRKVIKTKRWASNVAISC